MEAQCNALGSKSTIPQALKGRNNKTAHFAPSGLLESSNCFPGALHRAATFRPVGAEKLLLRSFRQS